MGEKMEVCVVENEKNIYMKDAKNVIIVILGFVVWFLVSYGLEILIPLVQDNQNAGVLFWMGISFASVTTTILVGNFIIYYPRNVKQEARQKCFREKCVPKRRDEVEKLLAARMAEMGYAPTQRLVVLARNRVQSWDATTTEEWQAERDNIINELIIDVQRRINDRVAHDTVGYKYQLPIINANELEYYATPLQQKV